MVTLILQQCNIVVIVAQLQYQHNIISGYQRFDHLFNRAQVGIHMDMHSHIYTDAFAMHMYAFTDMYIHMQHAYRHACIFTLHTMLSFIYAYRHKLYGLHQNSTKMI